MLRLLLLVLVTQTCFAQDFQICFSILRTVKEGRVEGTFSFYLNFMLLLRKAYQLLSDDNGEMYIQLPSFGNIELYRRWTQLLRDSGCKAYYFDGMKMKIVKTKPSPKRLPILIPRVAEVSTW